jgi:hypothetical protein
MTSIYELPLLCFDYATLSILQTLDRTLYSFVATAKKEMDEAQCIIEYLHRPETTHETKVNVILNSLPFDTVWNIFDDLQFWNIDDSNLYNIPDTRYVYLPCTFIINAIMYTSSYTHVYQGYSLIVNSQSHVVINNILGMSSRKQPHVSMLRAMYTIWRELNQVSMGVSHMFSVESNTIVSSWNTTNARLFKIDTHKCRVFLSDEFLLSNERKTCPAMSTYFRTELPNAMMKYIVLGMITTVD